MPKAAESKKTPGRSAGKTDCPAGMDLKRTYRLMAASRALEERLVKMSKSNDGYFWIGGPGEEAFNVPLGLQVHRGEGLDHDYLHLHYRSSAVLMAMGMEMIDGIRQMAAKATDPFSQGRAFVNHQAIVRWNVAPITSPIEVQYSIAPGTAWAQRNHGGRGITIVTGGDGGTAEPDFATCLNWSAMPGRELPILIVVVNNRYGISTPYHEVQSAQITARRAEAHGIPWDTVDGNDPVASYGKIREVMEYVRTRRKPFCLEAYVSRLHGHSSSSGAMRVTEERDCLGEFETYLVRHGFFTAEECASVREAAAAEALEGLRRVRSEEFPAPGSIYKHTFAGD